MDFGFVGSEPEWQRIKPQFDAQSAHSLVAVLLDSPTAIASAVEPKNLVDPSLRAVRNYSDFEELLADNQIDALILGSATDARSGRLRRIAQHGRSCLCLPVCGLDAILHHEVAMIADDSRTLLMPWLPARLHPAWRDFAALCTPDELASAQVILIECLGSVPTGRPLVAATYAEAADMLGSLVGEIIEVTATGDAAASRLVVQHRTATGLTGEIRIAPSSSESVRWRLEVQTPRSHVELLWESGLDGPAILRRHDNHETKYPGPAPDRGILADFERAIKREPHAISWSDAIRAAELADAAWLSLERRRSVDVFHEKRNELASFKGRMTSLGCGLIWFTLFMLILLAAAKGLQIPGADLLAAATVLVWLVFLGLQALRWVFPADAK